MVLLGSIEAIILSDGFARLCISDLAERLSCSKRTIYEIAPTKKALVLKALDVRGGNCEPILIPLSRPRERAGEREKYRSRFARARLNGTHVPLAILVLYRVGSVSA